MNTVKVKREELLTKVRSNRDAHRSLFLKAQEGAQEGYRKLVIEELDRMLADARGGRPIQRSVTLTEPSNHVKEMSVDETILTATSWITGTGQGSRFRPIQPMQPRHPALQADGRKTKIKSALRL